VAALICSPALPPLTSQVTIYGWSTRFNDLEYAMNFLAWYLINPNINIGRIVLEGESFDRILTRIRKLSDEIAREDSERGSRIKRWTSTVNDLKRRRNDVVHSQIVLDMATLDMVGWTKLRKETHEVDLSVSELNRLADDIESAIEELEQILGFLPS
jgi:hypothetical protein